MLLYTEDDFRGSYLEFLMGMYVAQQGVDFSLDFPEAEEFRPIYEQVLNDLFDED